MAGLIACQDGSLCDPLRAHGYHCRPSTNGYTWSHAGMNPHFYQRMLLELTEQIKLGDELGY